MKCSKSYSVVSFGISGSAPSELIRQLRESLKHMQKITLFSFSQTVLLLYVNYTDVSKTCSQEGLVKILTVPHQNYKNI
jgi:hypothetical protein